ncbi:hypothetical protein ASZ90_017951 [hydrocarbon metagenome]|uniref:Uncharacterized protein n=1 Tax=hydrocarbon metagenome TaxID=938273 RepID=A0A0W8E883_9ZZZZ
MKIPAVTQKSYRFLINHIILYSYWFGGGNNKMMFPRDSGFGDN